MNAIGAYYGADTADRVIDSSTDSTFVVYVSNTINIDLWEALGKNASWAHIFQIFYSSQSASQSRSQIAVGSNGYIASRYYYKSTDMWTSWFPAATATNPEEYSLPLADGLTGTAIYSKDQFGRVSLYLNLTADGTISHGATLCTLPSGYRPIKTESTIIESNSNPGTVENRKPIDVRVDPAGNVSVLYCYDNIADKTEMLIGRISFPAYG